MSKIKKIGYIAGASFLAFGVYKLVKNHLENKRTYQEEVTDAYINNHEERKYTELDLNRYDKEAYENGKPKPKEKKVS